MEIIKSVLVEILKEGKDSLLLPEIDRVIENLAKSRCIIALQDIQEILNDSALNDSAKVQKCVEILQQLEEGRHRIEP